MQTANLTWAQAEALALRGQLIRRYNWTDHWLLYSGYIWWIRPAGEQVHVAEATEITIQELLATDWTTLPAALDCNPPAPPAGSPPSDPTPPVTKPPGNGTTFPIKFFSKSSDPASSLPPGYVVGARFWGSYTRAGSTANPDSNVTLIGTSDNGLALNIGNNFPLISNLITAPEQPANPVNYTFFLPSGRWFILQPVNSNGNFASFDLECTITPIL